MSDGLVFEVRADGATVELVGTAAVPPKGDLAVPASVTSGSTTYEVAALAKNAFAACMELTSVSLPATLREVDPDAVAGCPSLKSISVSAKNEAFTSHDGMLFTKDYSRLLLIPEGMEGAAVIPGQTTYVPAQAFSRCLGSSLTAGDGSAEFASQNGMLFSKDLKTLVVCPPNVGSAVVLPAETEVIGEYALAGCKELTSITALGNVREIDATAFADEVKAAAVVALPAGEGYDERKAVWEAAGFQHFAEPAEPGTTTHPEADADAEVASGLVYTLLDDYTLSVAWEGGEDPAVEVEIPASAEINDVSYRVSTIAANAFTNRASLTSVKLPTSVTSIGESAFAGCANLASVNMPDSLQVINERAFEATSLTDIWLPVSVQFIGSRAFASCDSLTRIVALGTPQVADDVLAGCANLSIYSPYNEANTCLWNLGLIANNNHLLPYGLTLSEESLHLEVGQSANLFDNGLNESPEPCEVSYSYAAKPISVAPDGIVTAKAPGTSEVTATLTLNTQELTRTTRTVEVKAAEASKTEESTDPEAIILSETGHNSEAFIEREVALKGYGLTALSTTGGDLPTDGNTTDGRWELTSDGTLRIWCERPGAVIQDFGWTSETCEEGYWGPVRGLVKHIEMDSSVDAINMDYWFCRLINLEDEMTVFVPPSATSLRALFSRSSMRHLPDTFTLTNNVTNVISMFVDCKNLESLPQDFGTLAEGVAAEGMFTGCTALKALPDTFTLPRTMYSCKAMFYYCTSLTELPNGFRLPHSVTDVNDFNNMFWGCWSLQSLPEGFTMSDCDDTVKNLDGMFYDCSALITLPSGFQMAPHAYESFSMFNSCFSLTALPDDFTLTPDLHAMGSMFKNCTSLASLPDSFKFPTNPEKINSSEVFSVDSGRPTVPMYYNGPDDRVKNYPWATVNRTFYTLSNKLEGAKTITFNIKKQGEAGTGLYWTTAYTDASGKLAEPAAPSRAGYVFTLWYSDEACTQRADFTMPFDADTTVYGKLVPGSLGGELPCEANTGAAAWSLADDGALYIRGNGIINGMGWNDSNCDTVTNYWAPYRSLIVKASMSPSVRSRSVQYWLYRCNNLTDAFEFRIPTEVRNCVGTFWGCSSLTALPGDLAVPAGVSHTSSMFRNSGIVSVPSTLKIPTSLKNAAGMFLNCKNLTALPDDFGFAGCEAYIGNAFTNCISLTSLPAGFTFPDNWAGSTSDQPFYCTIAPGEPRVPLYYEGSNPSVLNYDWESQNRTLITNEDDAESSGMRQITLKVQSPDEVAGFPWETRSTVWTNKQGVLADQGAPTALDGYTFTGWCTDEACLTPVDFSQPVPAGVDILYGKWVIAGGFNEKLPLVENTTGDVWWRITADGTLSIQGEGDVADLGWNTITCTQGYWGPYRNDVKRIEMGESVSSRIMNAWFAQMKNLKDVSGFRIPDNTEEAQDLFQTCTALERVPSDFRLPESMRMATGLFAECTNLKELPESFVLPPNLVYANWMFNNCYSLSSLPAGFFIPKTTTRLNFMFQNCTALTSLPEGFGFEDPSSIVNLEYLFNGCSNLVYLPASLKTTELSADAKETMGYSFKVAGNTPLETYYAGDLANLEGPSTGYWATQNRTLTTTVPAGKAFVELQVPNKETGVYETWMRVLADVGAVMTEPSVPLREGATFVGWWTGASLETRFDFATQTVPADGLVLCAKYYNHSGALPTVSVPDNQDPSVAGWSFSDDGTLHITCSEGETIANLGWTNVKDGPGVYYTKEHWAPLRANVKRVVMDPWIKTISTAFWFDSMVNLVDAAGTFVPEGTLDVEFMFNNCASLASLPSDLVIPEGVGCTAGMIRLCPSLEKLPSGLRLPESVTNASGMFEGSGITSLPQGFTITKNLVDAQWMFQSCNKIEQFPVGFSLPQDGKLEFCTNMFSSMTSLKSLPEGFTVPNTVRKCTDMFNGCKALSMLPEGFALPDRSDVIVSGMFRSTLSLKVLPASLNMKKLLDGGWDPSAAGNNQMFLVYGNQSSEYVPVVYLGAAKNIPPAEWWTKQRRVLYTPNDPNNPTPLPNGVHTVKFVTSGAADTWNDYLTVLTDASGKVSDPGEPMRFGYSFEGWYADKSCTNRFDFSATVMSDDVVVYGKFSDPILSFTVPTSARVTVDASGAVTPAPVVFESRTPVALTLAGVEGSLASGVALLFPNEAERNEVKVMLHTGGDSIFLPLDGTNKRLSLELAAATASTPATLDAAIAIERNGAQINFQPGEDMATFAKLTWTIVPRG